MVQVECISNPGDVPEPEEYDEDEKAVLGRPKEKSI